MIDHVRGQRLQQSPVIDAEASGGTSFRDWVSERQKRDTSRRKGEVTRDRIRLATIELLNSVGYVDLKVSDICRKAKVTAPVLYLYFAGKEPLVHDILVEFLGDFISRSTSTTARTAYQAIYDANLQVARCSGQRRVDEMPAAVFGSSA